LNVILNREQIGGSPGRELALDCVNAGIAAADPARVVGDALSLDGSTLAVGSRSLDLNTYDRVVVLGGGNAAGYAAAAVYDVLGDWLDGGMVVTDNPASAGPVDVLAGDHPVPSQRGVDNTRRPLALADELGEQDLAIGVITGGGSALLAAPVEGVSLGDLQTVTQGLLASGATIDEINAVRKHLSSIKGGGLARRAAPADLAGLLLSDVVGDDRGVIASGPLSPDETTFSDARAVLATYDLPVPQSVEHRLDDGESGTVPETPGPGDDCFDSVSTTIIASNDTALDAAVQTAREAGYSALVLGSRFQGRATDVGTAFAGMAQSCVASGRPVEPPAVLVGGGETTVEITGDGTGGPNQEFALRGALEIDGNGVTLACVDTDGIDGNSDAAGGLVTAATVTDRQEAMDALARNDATTYLEAHRGTIRTGSTNTNVNDLYVAVVTEEGDDQ
jgi:hydroxypyruvate reductase